MQGSPMTHKSGNQRQKIIENQKMLNKLEKVCSGSIIDLSKPPSGANTAKNG
jgi:hypothetical protein